MYPSVRKRAPRMTRVEIEQATCVAKVHGVPWLSLTSFRIFKGMYPFLR